MARACDMTSMCCSDRTVTKRRLEACCWGAREAAAAVKRRSISAV